MCRPGGEPKRFQTRLKKLAVIKAEKESRRTGLNFRAYYCQHCGYWCITSKPQKTGIGFYENGGKKRRRKKRREAAIIAAWENEGGALHPKDLHPNE